MNDHAKIDAAFPAHKYCDPDNSIGNTLFFLSMKFDYQKQEHKVGDIAINSKPVSTSLLS